MPTLSVVIPTHNRSWLIKETIAYVLDQTFDNFEVIVIDNGSVDDTKYVVESINDSRIKYIFQNDSGSPAKPRNTGISLAKGKYISFLDDDDIWYPNKLATVVHAFESDPYPDIICHSEYENKHGKITKVLDYQSSRQNVFEHLMFHGNCLSGSATSAKTESLLEVAGFREEPEFFEIEDYDLWIRLALSGKTFHFIPEPLGEFVIHQSNDTLKGLHRRYPNHRRMLKEHLKDAKKVSLLDHIRFQIIILRTFYSQCRLYLEKWKRSVLRIFSS